MNDDIIWETIDKYFKQNKYFLSNHNLESYNDFLKNKIISIFRDIGPLNMNKDSLKTESNDFRYTAQIYFGTKKNNYENIYIDIPTSEDTTEILLPSEARLKNLNYSSNIYCDVEIIITEKSVSKNKPEKTIIFEKTEKIKLGKIPVMLHSDYCILKNKTPEILEELGECIYDQGGYFIIDGKEKIVISQEKKKSSNKLYLSLNKEIDKQELFTHKVSIQSIKESSYDTTIREMDIKIMNTKNIVVKMPYFNNNIYKHIPLFIIFRALGIESDKKIIEIIFNSKYELLRPILLDIIKPSIYEAGFIKTQEDALNYLKSFLVLQKKQQSIESVYFFINKHFLPHINNDNDNYNDTRTNNGYKNVNEVKAYFLGYMINKLIKFKLGVIKETDPDSLIYKRIEPPGVLMASLFREYYDELRKKLKGKLNDEYTYKVEKKIIEFQEIFTYQNFSKIIDPLSTEIENGLVRGLKGNWNSPKILQTNNTSISKVGISEELDRISIFSFYSQLVRIKNPITGQAAKIPQVHYLHSTHIGVVCPIDTPDGQSCGIRKHKTIMAKITSGISDIESDLLINFLYKRNVIKLNYSINQFIYNMTKIFVDGVWIGIIKLIEELVLELKQLRRERIIDKYISICWNIKEMELHINGHSGRMSRPLFIVENQNIKNIEYIRNHSWDEMIGNYKNNENKLSLKNYIFLPKNSYRFINKASIEYLDIEEINCSLISTNYNFLKNNKYYTHCEIHESLMLSFFGLIIPFSNHNPLPRNLYGIGQTKQSIGVYASNYYNRMDQTSKILNYPQKPLVQTRFQKYYGELSLLHGFNVIAAFATYGGYNQEDAVIINKSSIEKGLFITTAYSTYSEMRIEGKEDDNFFLGNPTINNSDNIKYNNNYSKLDENGIVKKDEIINDNDVIIGKYISSINEEGQEIIIDNSIIPTKGSQTIVDKSYLRKEKIPEIGDKLSARHGQKGVIGMIVPAKDMPYTKDGIVPDIILNPHCIPSRMTIGQFLECLLSKKGAFEGKIIDGTIFLGDFDSINNNAEVIKHNENTFEKYGNEVLYNGYNGRQMECNIFIGPTYYQRLKQMVSDKIHARREGICQLLTKQPAEGRSRGGGSRIGEMERDSIIAHGISGFLKESFYERSDGKINAYPYIVCINKKTGLIDSSINKSIDNEKEMSYIKIPYSFKLLIQELVSMNINLRLIT
jgi:DNA-directed RNA polymerase II subunit RPB2